MAGRTQQQLARTIGLHPDVLSHKLNGLDSAVLTTADVIAIVTALAGWGALTSKADVAELLDLMAVPPYTIPAAAWERPPLAALSDAGGTAPIPPLMPREAATGTAVPSPRPAVADAGPAASATGQHQRMTVPPLPAPATALIGRERELAAISAALSASRLVTLTGSGGTGKTRLALHAGYQLAGRFRDGAAFADLASVADPALLATAIAGTLGLAPPSAGAAEGQLTAVLRDKEFLLILDNLEQLLDGVPQIARILAAAPELRVLATSRIALRLYGERTLRVPPLSLPGDDSGDGLRGSEAVRLFIERARAVRPDFEPDDDGLARVAAVCTALDGLPLAIELAAARTRLYTPGALLPLLGSRLAVLTGGPRDVPRRQQTLRATLDWSHQLLPAAERHLFACLGVFGGPFDAAAAAAIGGESDPAATLEHLTELADQSMIEVIPGAPPHFQLLATMREYALARLAAAGTQDEVRRRHLDYYLTMAVDARARLTLAEKAARLGLLGSAYPNIRTAIEFTIRQAELDGSCLEAGMRLATAVGPLWRQHGPLAEGELYFSRLLGVDQARGRAASPRVRAEAALEACALACFSGDYGRATELGRDCAALFDAAGDQHGLAWAHRFLGEAAFSVGDHAAAGDHFERALHHARRTDDAHDQAVAGNMLGQFVRHRGDRSRSRTLLRQAVRQFGASGDLHGMASALHSLAETERDLGNLSLARRLFRIALRHHDALGGGRSIAYDLEGLATIACLTGDGRQALRYLGAAQRLRAESGAPLPPVERDLLARVCEPALAAIPAGELADGLSQARNQPLAAVIALALGQPRTVRSAVGG